MLGITQPGLWTVLREVEPLQRMVKGKPRLRRQILCRCFCGVERVVLLEVLRAGASQRCRVCSGKATARHGHYAGNRPTPEYTAWMAMKNRCSKPRNASYAYYGGRGIGFCERWKDFANFLTDMGLRPSPEHSLDRLDCDSDYSPENCRWATVEEQHNNRRVNCFLTFNGETLTVAQWARRRGWRPNVIHGRLEDGWPIEKALIFPLRTGNITANGETLPIGQWAKRLDVHVSTLHTRLNRGWTPERAVTTPKDATRRDPRPRRSH